MDSRIVLPAHECGEDGQVGRGEFMSAGLEYIRHGRAALVDKHSRLAGAHDELRPVFDLVNVAPEAADHRLLSIRQPHR